MASPKTYTTMQGDCWDAIAFKLWSEERLFDKLLEANPDQRRVCVFEAGAVLIVPTVATPNQRDIELPPWKTRGGGL